MTDRATPDTDVDQDDVDTTAVEGDRRHLLQRVRMPDTYVVLGIVLLLAAVATWLVPAGVFDRVPGPDDREVVDPDTYTRVAQTPVSALELMTAIPRGMVAAADIIVFTLMIGGAFSVLRATGIIEAGIGRLASRFAGRGVLAIPVLMVVFAGIATVIGTQELALVYVPVLVPLMIALRFDSVTAVAVALCATTTGFASGILNPVNTGLGQQIAGVELFSGAGVRAIAFVLLLGAAVFFVVRYARRVRADPAASLLAGDPAEAGRRETFAEPAEPAPLTSRQRLAALVVLGMLALLVWGVLTQGWFFLEMSGLFIVLGLAAGLVGGLGLTEVCRAFDRGFREVLVGAVVAGIARAITVVLEDGQILDTVVHALAGAVEGIPAWLAAVGMFGVQFVLSFVVSSGSGQALVTMPIMAPLSDVVGLDGQIAVLAYQLADGTGNILFPTSGYFMAVLALAGVPWQKWLRFYLPVYAAWVGISLVLLVTVQAAGWT